MAITRASSTQYEENRKARNLRAGLPICLAPWTSMFFKHDGTMMACCRNKTEAYGRYPDHSVAQAWEGLGRAMLAEQIRGERLPPGCHDCEMNAATGNHTGMLACHFDSLARDFSFDARGPLTMEFELGTNCNFECIMCSGWCSSSIRKNREKLPPFHAPYDAKFVEQLRPYIPGLKDARFLGGEPFLNRLNFRVWKLLMELNPSAQVSITTNGSILSDRVKEVITTLKARIVVSLESLMPGNYEAIRVNGDIARLRRHLEWLLEHDALDSITVCPIRQNWQDLPGIASFCNRNQVPVWFNTVVEPAHCSMKYMPVSELDEAIRYLSSAQIEPTPAHLTPRFDWSVEECNHRRYRDLVQLLIGWRAEALDRQSVELVQPDARAP
ncbi:MAG TPA: radical SAM protein [Bdellovibrionota bacterium]|nr:radical SAM protein [Bdellovibrionota bacterium]